MLNSYLQACVLCDEIKEALLVLADVVAAVKSQNDELAHGIDDDDLGDDVAVVGGIDNSLSGVLFERASASSVAQEKQHRGGRRRYEERARSSGSKGGGEEREEAARRVAGRSRRRLR